MCGYCRLTGRDGVLIILGEPGTAMEAFADQWSPLGRMENAWAVHSKAFAEVRSLETDTAAAATPMTAR